MLRAVVVVDVGVDQCEHTIRTIAIWKTANSVNELFYRHSEKQLIPRGFKSHCLKHKNHRDNSTICERTLHSDKWKSVMTL